MQIKADVARVKSNLSHDKDGMEVTLDLFIRGKDIVEYRKTASVDDLLQAALLRGRICLSLCEQEIVLDSVTEKSTVQDIGSW